MPARIWATLAHRRPLATRVTLLVLLIAALLTRLINLGAYTGKFDEGIRAEQLLLMSAGFRPVRDIFAAQGPLSLDIFFPPYMLFGETLAAARSAVVVYSLAGLLAMFWAARLASGLAGGLIAVAFLVLSSLYLKNSRLALLEVPALLPAIVALGSAIWWMVDGRAAQRRAALLPLLLSAVAFALALLIKPIVLPVAVPIGLALLLRPSRRWSDLALYAAVAAAVILLVMLLYGPREVWEQQVAYRGYARQMSGWSLRENWSILLQELRDESLATYALAAVGGVALAVLRPRLGVLLLSWPLASLGLLLFYAPLQFKHTVILLPPLALCAGAGLGAALGALAAIRHQSRRVALTTPLVLLLGWYVASLPSALRGVAAILSAQTETRVETYAEDSELLARLSQPDEFVIVDEPIVAFNARRMVPPYLVDTSSYRLRSGALKGDDAVAQSVQYDVRLQVLFSDGLREIRRYEDYVDSTFQAVRITERQNGKDRAVYLRKDADFEMAREVLTRELSRSARVEFGGDLELLGYQLSQEEVRPGASLTLSLHWEALRAMPIDYHVITHLRRSGGEPHYQTERGLGGGGQGTTSWDEGRWVVRAQSLPIPPRAQPGEYLLSLSLYDSKARESQVVTTGIGLGTTETPLGMVRVR